MLKKNRKDFVIRPNRQPERKQTDLWDVTAGKVLITTVQGEAAAQEVADNLNRDPWFLDRGQTRFELRGAVKSVPRND
jgi:hypothetical protein